MKDFFIIYHCVDLDLAEWVCSELEFKNFTISLEAWDTKPGISFTGEVGSVFEFAKCIILLISPDFLKITFSIGEWDHIFTNSSNDISLKIIPIRIKYCNKDYCSELKN